MKLLPPVEGELIFQAKMLLRILLITAVFAFDMEEYLKYRRVGKYQQKMY